MNRKTGFIMIILSALLLAGCGRQVAPPPPPPPTNDQARQLPEAIEAWIEDSKTIFLAQTRELDGMLYLLVTYGEKRTGGYVVEIGEVVLGIDKLVVPVRLKRPAPGEVVTQALTHPYDLKIINATDLPVAFVPSGDEEYLPTLIGIDELRSIVASSAGIKLFAPSPESAVSRQFVLDGVANVFEGNVQYKLLDENGRLLDSGFTTGAMGDWGYFQTELTVPEDVAVGERLLLDVFTESAKDGTVEQQIFYELILK